MYITLTGWFVLMIFVIWFGALCACINNYCSYVYTEEVSGKIRKILYIVFFLFGIFMYFAYNGHFRNIGETNKLINSSDSDVMREVKVFDSEGDLIQDYKGRFIVEQVDDRVTFVDEDNKRHDIYYGRETIVVDELDNFDSLEE